MLGKLFKKLSASIVLMSMLMAVPAFAIDDPYFNGHPLQQTQLGRLSADLLNPENIPQLTQAFISDFQAFIGAIIDSKPARILRERGQRQLMQHSQQKPVHHTTARAKPKSVHAIVKPLLRPVTLVDAASQNPARFHTIFNQPWQPRLLLEGVATNRTLGEVDMMVPVVGNNAAFFYGDIDTRFASRHDWLGGIGGGYRQMVNNHHILGAYVFAEYSKDAARKRYWTINPGLESLSDIWDFRANAYIPVGKKRQLTNRLFLNQLGIFNNTHFSGHSEFDTTISFFEETAVGAEGEIGRTVPGVKGLRAFAGPYFFKMQHGGNVTGIETRAEYKVNPIFTITAHENYDNLIGNSVGIGLRIYLDNDPHKNSTTIAARMLTKVEHNLATPSNGHATPIRTGEEEIGPEDVENTNIWFFAPGNPSFVQATGVKANPSAGTPEPFDPDKGSANCTFEHPCLGFDQNTADGVHDIAPNASLFFAPGNYFEGGNLTLNDGQDIQGRAAGYFTAATGNDRPLFQGSITMANDSGLENLRIQNIAGTQDIGVDITGVDNVTITNSEIGALDTATGFRLGMNVANANNIVVDSTTSIGFLVNGTNDRTADGLWINTADVTVQNGSDIRGIASMNVTGNITTSNNTNGFGIRMFGSDTLVVDASSVLGQTTYTATGSITANEDLAGIISSGFDSITIRNGSTVTGVVNATAGGAIEGLLGRGMHVLFGGDVTIDNSTVTSNVTVANGGNNVTTVQAAAINFSGDTLSVTNSIMNANATYNNVNIVGGLLGARGIINNSVVNAEVSNTTFNITTVTAGGGGNPVQTFGIEGNVNSVGNTFNLTCADGGGDCASTVP